MSSPVGGLDLGVLVARTRLDGVRPRPRFPGGAIRRVKAAAVLGGANAERAQEGAAHRLGCAKAASRARPRRPARRVSSSARRAASRRTLST